jgi:hypothetical protein
LHCWWRTVLFISIYQKSKNRVGLTLALLF